MFFDVVVPVVPSVARRSRPDDGGQLQDGGHSDHRPDRWGRPSAAGLDRPPRPRRGSPILLDFAQLRRIGLLRVPHPTPRIPTPDRHARRAMRPGPSGVAQGGRGRLALCPRQRVSPRHRGGDRHVRTLFSNIAFATLHRVRRPGASAWSPAEIGIILGSATLAPLFGAVHGQSAGANASGSGGRSWSRCFPGRSRRPARRDRPGVVPGAVPCRRRTS